MKKLFVFLFAILTTAAAQFKQGDVEIALTGSFGSMKTESTSSGITTSKNYTYLLLSVQPSYYLVNGFSVGPGIDILAAEGSKPSQSFFLNLSYIAEIPNTKLGAYGILGYGFSNAATIPGSTSLMRSTNDLDIGTLHLGGGVKLLVSKSASLKLEIFYRSQRWTYDYKSLYYSYKTDYSYSFFGVLYGVSVIL